jgi:hypothetical protein
LQKVTFATEAQPLQQSERWLVAHIHLGDDPMQFERAKEIIEQGGEGFGGIALTLMRPGQRIADLGLLRVIGLDQQRAIAEQLVSFVVDKGKLKPFAPPARFGFVQRREKGASGRLIQPGPALKARHFGVATIGDQRRQILFGKTPQRDPPADQGLKALLRHKKLHLLKRKIDAHHRKSILQAV